MRRQSSSRIFIVACAVTIGLILIVAILLAKMGDFESGEAKLTPILGDKEISANILEIDAENLAKIFYEGNVSTDNFIRGRKIKVHGTVQSTVEAWPDAGMGSHNTPTIMLKGFRQDIPVFAVVRDSERKTMSKLKAGDRIVITCDNIGQGEAAGLGGCIIG